jgi:hypothetical protein
VEREGDGVCCGGWFSTGGGLGRKRLREYEMREEGDEHAGEDLNELNKMKSQIRMLTVHRATKWKKTHIRSVRKEVLFLSPAERRFTEPP